MKEFDLEKAKAGAPVCTRAGRPARIICFDYQEFGKKDADEEFPIIALVKYDEGEKAFVYRESGKCTIDKNDELMMASVKHEGWCAVSSGTTTCANINIYPTREAAEKAFKKRKGVVFAHIEWEE